MIRYFTLFTALNDSYDMTPEEQSDLFDEVLESSGYYVVDVVETPSIKKWLDKNSQKAYYYRPSIEFQDGMYILKECMIFEEEEDAVLFKLSWDWSKE